jgi:hypothetical protein
MCIPVVGGDRRRSRTPSGVLDSSQAVAPAASGRRPARARHKAASPCALRAPCRPCGESRRPRDPLAATRPGQLEALPAYRRRKQLNLPGVGRSRKADRLGCTGCLELAAGTLRQVCCQRRSSDGREPCPLRRAGVAFAGDEARLEIVADNALNDRGRSLDRCDNGIISKQHIGRPVVLQPVGRCLLRGLQAPRPDHLPDHHGDALLQPLHAVRDAHSSQHQSRARAALRCISGLSSERVNVGLDGELRSQLRGTT